MWILDLWEGCPWVVMVMGMSFKVLGLRRCMLNDGGGIILLLRRVLSVAGLDMCNIPSGSLIICISRSFSSVFLLVNHLHPIQWVDLIGAIVVCG